MIVVTGATGNVGRHVVAGLAEAGHAVRVVVRDPAGTDVGNGGVAVARGDLDQPESLASAFASGSKLFLLAPGPDVPAQDAAAIRAAMGASIGHIVMLSSLGAELGGIAGGGPHLPGEQRLKDSGADWTLLHPSEFMNNALWLRQTIAESGSIFLPAGTGKIGFIDPADIGAAAARVLATGGHHGKTYRLTGPEALGLADVAARIGEAIARPVRYVDIPEDAYRQALAGLGLPPAMIESQVTYYAAVRAGRVDIVTDDVQRLTGRPATSYADWAKEHAAAFG